MIAFVTALRARALANDWNYHVWLLERTVGSMLAQTGSSVAVVIGCHDVPDTALTRDARVHFIQTTIPHPERSFDDMSVDKVIKHSLGAAWAVDQGCEYVIFNDADDLVSNRIGAFVRDHPGEPGWYAASQRFYSYGGLLVRYSAIGGSTSGPCVVVRADLLTFASPPFAGPWVEITRRDGEEYLGLLAARRQQVCLLNAVGHGHYRELMTLEGHPLKPLPFPANLVINHADSMSTAGGVHGYPLISSLGSLRRSLRWAPTIRLATPGLRREFGVPSRGKIPHAYRASGSVFWR